MAMDFKNSETKDNLMRAFAGESQARNRYTMAAGKAKKENLYVIQAAFQFTADQEKEHAEIFYNHLQSMAGETITVDGGYPVDLQASICEMLRAAQHNEYEEYEPVYKTFAAKANEEGFPQIAASFNMIADIEKTHGDRFGMLADMLAQNKLFVSDVETTWVCLNCGHVQNSKQAPNACPACQHNQGYFVRIELAPFTKAN